MQNLTDMLERARHLRSPDPEKPLSWYALAKLLDVSQARLWNWRHGQIPDNNGALAIAKALNISLEVVIDYLEEDRAKKLNKPRVASTWSARLPRVLPSVAIASASLMALAGALTAGTSTAAARSANFTRYTLCALRTRIRRAQPAPA